MTKLEQAARQVVDAWDLGEFSTRMDEAITALRKALDPELQFVRDWNEGKVRRVSDGKIMGVAEQAEQEPVCIDWDTKTDEPIMGYAAPVRTKDLTDDEIEKAFWENGHTEIEGCRAVIAADREKNK